jgi:hypothetical protein
MWHLAKMSDAKAEAINADEIFPVNFIVLFFLFQTSDVYLTIPAIYTRLNPTDLLPRKRPTWKNTAHFTYSNPPSCARRNIN